MNINDVLKEYRTVEEKNIIITDPNGNLLYKSEKMDIRTDIVLNKIRSLTGLYNKGKYMALKNADFGKPESIAIFNFDVNNLKHINDNYGHEYGDALIIKAAKSIDAVTSENVYGFRMGGDEYVMVAVNVSPEEVGKIRATGRLHSTGSMRRTRRCSARWLAESPTAAETMTMTSFMSLPISLCMRTKRHLKPIT